MEYYLSDRMKRILQAVIEDYIMTAEPVGSRTVSKKTDMGLSPASIRNIMADLEEMGLLFQPFTSAGRLPTEKGFRLYVDSILDVHDLSDDERRNIRSRYGTPQTEGIELFRETSRILSSSSHYLGVVWAPRMSLIVLQHVEFVRLRQHLILAILVATTGIVHNQILEVEQDFSQSELDQLSDYLNSFLAGLTLQQVREKLLEQMEVEKSVYDQLLQQAITLGQKAFLTVDETDVFIEGRPNILNEPEFGNLAIMADLFRAFEQKATMVRLLETCMHPRGVQIAIGSESRVHEIEACSLITSTYSCNGEVLGALGVIGPRRMNYSRVIPLVDYTAKLLTEMLESA